MPYFTMESDHQRVLKAQRCLLGQTVTVRLRTIESQDGELAGHEWVVQSAPPSVRLVEEKLSEPQAHATNRFVSFRWHDFTFTLLGPSTEPVIFEQLMQSFDNAPSPCWTEMRVSQPAGSGPDWVDVEVERPYPHDSLDVLLSQWQPGRAVTQGPMPQQIRPAADAYLDTEARAQVIAQVRQAGEERCLADEIADRWQVTVPGPPALTFTEIDWPHCYVRGMEVRPASGPA